MIEAILIALFMALPFASFFLNWIAKEEFSYIKPYLRITFFILLFFAAILNLAESFFSVLFIFILALFVFGIFVVFVLKRKKDYSGDRLIFGLSDYALLFSVFPVYGTRFFLFSASLFFWYYFSYSSLNHEFEVRYKVFDSLFFFMCFVLTFVLFRM